MSWLTTLAGFIPFLNAILGWFERRRARQEAREVVAAEVAKAEAEATREAAIIVAEHREPSVAEQRLDKGTF